MPVQHIWNLFQLLGLSTCCKLANLSWNFVTETCKQHPETTRSWLCCEKLGTSHDVHWFISWVYCCWKRKWWSDQRKTDRSPAKFALKITTKSAVFYRLLFGEVCPEISREIPAKLADFSMNLFQKSREIWLFSPRPIRSPVLSFHEH